MTSKADHVCRQKIQIIVRDLGRLAAEAVAALIGCHDIEASMRQSNHGRRRQAPQCSGKPCSRMTSSPSGAPHARSLSQHPEGGIGTFLSSGRLGKDFTQILLTLPLFETSGRPRPFSATFARCATSVLNCRMTRDWTDRLPPRARTSRISTTPCSLLLPSGRVKRKLARAGSDRSSA